MYHQFGRYARAIKRAYDANDEAKVHRLLNAAGNRFARANGTTLTGILAEGAADPSDDSDLTSGGDDNKT